MKKNNFIIVVVPSMIWRVRGSLTKATDRAGYDDTNLSLIETRFQVKF